MSMASEAIEAKLREAVYAEAKRTGRPFSRVWAEMGGETGEGLREQVRLTADIGKAAGELLAERAQARARRDGIDYRAAFAEEARRAPAVARAYGLPDPDRPAAVPWWRRPAPGWRKRKA